MPVDPAELPAGLDHPDSIITNHTADGPVVIDVATSDEAVETSGCQTFEKIG